jgi:hypothetical protein
MGTVQGRTDPLGQFRCIEPPSRFHNPAFTVSPDRFDRVEPRALDRQQATDEAPALSRLLDLAVVLAQPGAHLGTDVPRGIIPDHKSAVLPARSTCAAHPLRNWIVTALTGRPSTKRRYSAARTASSGISKP